MAALAAIGRSALLTTSECLPTGIAIKMASSAIAIATLGAAIITFAPSLTSADAQVPTPAAESVAPEQSHGPACSQKAWPYYESKCVRAAEEPKGHTRQVRIIFADRVAPR